MRRIATVFTVSLVLAFSANAETVQSLQRHCDKWTRRFGLGEAHVTVHKASEVELIMMRGAGCFGFSRMGKEGHVDIWVLEEKDYPVALKLTGDTDILSRKRIRHDQRDTVVHELVHVMLELGDMDDDAREQVVVTLSGQLDRVR